MENKDLYKKIINEIHAPEDLKKRTLNQINNKTSKKVYLKYLEACAVFVLAVTALIYRNFYALDNNNITKNSYQINETKEIANSDDTTFNETDLPTFKDIDELRALLKEHYIYNDYIGISKGDVALDSFDSFARTESATNSEESDISSSSTNKSQDLLSDNYSTTNVQVEGVDEADIVKTDGKYIYYVTYSILHIINADTLEEVKSINYRKNENLTENFSPSELYLVNDKLVVVGNYYSYEIEKKLFISSKTEEVSVSNSKNYAKAIIYDISNPKEIKVNREIKLDGSYNNSRMIGNNLYFISSKTPVYYDGIKDIDLLPSYQDTYTEERLFQLIKLYILKIHKITIM